MDTNQFRGLWTALITPFKQGNGIDNEIDFDSLETILEMQKKAGVTGILLLGTTGENPTLNQREGLEIVKFAINKLEGKIKVMVNVGTYSTNASLENIKEYDKIDGIDSYLVVNPYYNKPTQTGLFKHFTTIAKSTSKPIILYNIHGRTSVNLETNTLIDILAESPNIVGVKEASGNMLQMKEVIENTGENFLVLSGDDGLTYELIKNGGDGVISVASNCKPKEIQEFVNLCLEGNKKSKNLNEDLNEFFSKLFIQTNPLPVKTYLAYKGIIKEEFRLPMCKMDKNHKKDFLDFIKEKNF